MKKTLIAVACAAFISTGAIAKPMPHNNGSKPHNGHTVHMVDHGHKPAPHHAHSKPHRPTKVTVAHHHHHHNDTGAILLGDFILAFALLASNAM